MKTGKLLFMVLVLLLGTAVAASAVTIHSPWGVGHHEENLYQDHGAWDFSADNHPSRHAPPLESLSADTFSIHHYALNLGEPRHRGMHHWPQWIPERHHRFHDDGFHRFAPEHSRNWGWDRTFREASHFGFFEAFRFLATRDHDSAPSHHHWANGSISDLGELNLLYLGQYLIAFEPGNHLNFRGLDGNFLVVQVYRLDNASSVPLPGTLPLLAGGLACLGILRSYKRRFTSAG
jgi:hypothetical protein